MQNLSGVAGGLAYLFKGALTKDECRNIISISERKGKHDNTTYCNKDVLHKQHRTKYADYDLSERIYSKVQSMFEKKVGRKYSASNTMMTYVVYENGGECPLHKDSKVPNGIGKTYYVTVIVYLNDFKGGRTYFQRDGKKKQYVNGQAGDIMIFEGVELPHGCEPVIGQKQILIFGIELV